MGEKPNSLLHGKSVAVSPGVTTRCWKNSTSIRLSFQYRGVECRETLSLPVNKANIAYVQRLRCEIINAIGRGTFDYTEYFPHSKRAVIFGHVQANPLIGDLLVAFLTQAKRALQPSTVIGYQKVCNAHLFRTFGKMRVKDLTPAFIRAWVLQLQLTAKSLRNVLVPLRAVLNDAVNDDIIQRNPLDRVVLSKLLDKDKCRSDYMPDPFSIEEIQVLLSHAEGQVKNLIQFAFFSGLRTSELIGLQWQDIDWEKGIAHICRAVVAKQEKCTKTKSGVRDLLLLPPALEALIAQKPYTFSEGKWVFHNPHTQKTWLVDSQIRAVWKRLLKRSGVRYRNLYMTRHTFGSMLLSSNENLLWLGNQMGHRDTQMLLKVYAKWLPNAASKVGYQLVNDWSKVLSTKPAPHETEVFIVPSALKI